MEEDDFSNESLPDSDVELQEAFVRGELKPGLVILKKQDRSLDDKPKPTNNVERLKTLLKRIQLPSSFGWVEKLDVSSSLAPLAPEIAVQLDEHREKREKHIRNINAQKSKKGITPAISSIEDDPIHNDFQRELNFHRQAQSAIMSCLPKLKSLGIPTRRPDDYFAEMAKTDSHMQKVASVLLKKQTSAEKAEKVRKIRDQKKIAKQTQVHVLQERQKAKKEMIESVKKYRKGQKNSLDFLEERRTSQKSSKRPNVNKKRELKNERYGYGGKKSGYKRNTKESLDNIPSRGGGRGRGGTTGRLGNMNRGRRSGDGGRTEKSMSRGGGGSSSRNNNGEGRGGGRGKAGGRASGMAKKAKRPGKANRMKAKGRSK